MVSATAKNRNERSIRLAHYWIFAVCGIFAIALILTPTGNSRSAISIAGTAFSLPDLCQFKLVFGRDCPGCGMTRSFIYTARFQFTNAWFIQPIGTLLAILLAASIPHRLWKIHRLSRNQSVRSTTRIEVSIVITLAGLCYARWLWNLV